MKIRAALLVVLGLVLAGLVTGCGDKKESPEAAPSSSPSGSASSSAPAAEPKSYDAYPPMSIDTKKKYTATFELAKGGSFEIALFADKAPKTVNSFVFLARDKYFDGLTFHRVITGFMAQGGDPTGTGRGGPGYEFEDEFADDLVFDKAGILAMANSGPNSNGSQFFITFVPTPHLNGLHTIFGQVTKGLDVVLGITVHDADVDSTPGDAIKTVTITEK